MKRADFDDVMRPKPGELKMAFPVLGSAVTVRLVFGPSKLVWFSTLKASARTIKERRSRIGNLREIARSRLVSCGRRVVFRPRLPMLTGSTVLRVAPLPVNRGPVGMNGKF